MQGGLWWPALFSSFVVNTHRDADRLCDTILDEATLRGMNNPLS